MIFLLVPVLAFIPAFFWFFIFLREDRFDPEPKKLIIKLFLMGAVVGIAAAFLEFATSFFFQYRCVSCFQVSSKIQLRED